MRNSLLSIVLCLSAVPTLPAQVRIVSHVTASDGGFSTTVVVENTAAVSQTVTLTPFDTDGNQLEAVTLTIVAQSVFRDDANSLLGNSASHFTIAGASDIKVNSYYDFKAGDSSPAFVGESTTQGSSWRIFTGNWDKIFDGIAVVNTGEVATDVWINQKNEQNEIIATKMIAENLQPNAKALFIIGHPNLRPFEVAEGYFEVSASQMLAVTALQGTLENEVLNILLASESRPLSQSFSKRDDRGVWFIENGSLYDVFEMMGYNVASDRLWQMEMFRRMARGTIAEIASVNQFPELIEIDIEARRHTYSDAELDAFWADMDEESKIMLQSYVDGTNRRIAQVNATPELMPFEYSAIGETAVQLWTIHDSMAYISYFQKNFSLNDNGAEQVLNAVILQGLTEKYGAEQAAVMFNDIRHTSDPEGQSMIADDPAKMAPASEQPLAYLRDDLPDLSKGAAEYVARINRIRSNLQERGILIKGGSYAWAVAGSKTASGNPVLYSGPQVGFAAPILFVEGSIVSDAITVSGAAVPGIPSILVGRTPHHAWSMQVGSAGSWDYYIEDESNIQVVRQETVVLKDAEDMVIDIEASSHGPILQDLGGVRLAWKYAHRGYEFNLAKGLLDLARAESMDAFGEAVSNLAVSQHLCYVDRDGNIAYWHAGRQPERSQGDYRVPQGMLADQEVLEWDASVVEAVPHERNPDKGYFAGWNNQPTPDFVDHSATNGFGPYHRAHIIEEFFQNEDPDNKWTFEQLSALAIEIGATGNWGAGGNPWTQIGEAVSAALIANPTTERQAILDLFTAWDGHDVAGGPDNWVHGSDLQDASLFLDFMIPLLLTKTFDDEIGASQDQGYGRFQNFIHGLYDRGLNNTYDWFTNLDDASAPQSSEAIILATVDELLATYGSGPWGTGARSSFTYPHTPFGPIAAPPLSLTTPTPASKRATYAMCVEYDNSGPIRIDSVFALGQSGTITGNPASFTVDEFAFSMKEDFDNFSLRSFPLFP